MKPIKKLFFIIPLILLLYSCGFFRRNVEQPTVIKEKQTENNQYPLYSVKSGSVYDGDTLRVLTPNGEVKVRLACVDSREIQQEGGVKDRNYLRSLLEQNRNQVRLQKTDTDRYGRTVAVLYLANGEAVQEIQAKNGMAFPYAQYKSDCPIWNKVESAGNQAKAKRLGVWSNPNPEYPWDWRKNNK